MTSILEYLFQKNVVNWVHNLLHLRFKFMTSILEYLFQKNVVI